MRSVYILTFIKKEPEEKYYFMSLISIFIKFRYKELRVKYATMGNYKFSAGEVYENAVIRIERVEAYTKPDVLKENPDIQTPE